MNDLLEAIVIGVVQGITEWLPVSSEGVNTLILSSIFGETPEDALALSLWLHLGTAFAGLVYFRYQLLEIFKKIIVLGIHPLLLFLIISTVISGIIALIIVQFIEFIMVSSFGVLISALIGGMMIFTGLLQYMKKDRNVRKSINQVNWRYAIFVGILQGFSVIPGISRSGITSVMLIRFGLSPENALRVSFLMGIPAGLMASFYEIYIGNISFDKFSIVSLIFAFIVGILSIKVLLKVAEVINFGVFVLALGLLVILGSLVVMFS